MAEKEDMLTWLDQMIEEYIGDSYDLSIDWNHKQHRIEIFMRLFAENKEDISVVDVCDVEAENIIEFEDSILLFSGNQENIDENDYLKIFSFDRRRGMDRATLAAIIMMMREVLDEGQSDLLDFMTDDDIEEFELKWPEQQWLDCLQKAQQRYGNYQVAYPKF